MAARYPRPRPPRSPQKPISKRKPASIVNDPEKAFALAAKKKLPLMIDFFGIWCPPCNHLDADGLLGRIQGKTDRNASCTLKLDADQDRFNDAQEPLQNPGTSHGRVHDARAETRSSAIRVSPIEELLRQIRAGLSRTARKGMPQLEATGHRRQRRSPIQSGSNRAEIATSPPKPWNGSRR